MSVSYDNNMEVSPSSMREVAGRIKTTGNNYNEKISSVYSKLKDMNNFWKGAEYDACYAKFESLKATLDSLGELISTTIPNDLQSAADTYTSAQNNIRSMFS